MNSVDASGHFHLSERFSLSLLRQGLQAHWQVQLSDQVKETVSACRAYLDNAPAVKNGAVYGINTGFGSLCNIRISDADTEQLQYNLIMSHCAGTGDYMPTEVVRLLLLLKMKGLSLGHSGVQLETVERLAAFYNNEVYPKIHTLGSLGASGDLVPLAEMSLPLIGLGEVQHKDLTLTGKELQNLMQWEPIALKSKEGLALLNGTQFMSSYATACLLALEDLLGWAITIAAISVDAFYAKSEPFNALIHEVRGYKGQALVAEKLLELLEGSPIGMKAKQQVQDPYSFRCTPQVLGASIEALRHVAYMVETEMNAVTDNPLIFPEEDLILSGGNFHGQPLALSLDYLAIAAAEIGNLSERRTYQLVGGLRGLPDFLIENGGLNSGLMIPQYAAAAIVSQNKQLCTPSSVDSIPSCNGQEDHVSMGANAATKAWQVVNNLRRILSIELLNANQALYLRKEKTSPVLETVLTNYREALGFDGINTDDGQTMNTVLAKSEQFLKQHLPPIHIPLGE